MNCIYNLFKFVISPAKSFANIFFDKEKTNTENLLISIFKLIKKFSFFLLDNILIILSLS